MGWTIFALWVGPFSLTPFKGGAVPFRPHT